MLIGARLFFGLLTLAALLYGFTDFTVRRGMAGIYWFSFFTILSNIFSAVVLIAGAAYLIGRRQPNEIDDVIRGSAVVAIAIVGIVFGLLLSGIENPEKIGWVNAVVHYIIPVVMVLDWLIQPPKSRLSTKHIWYWLIYPAAYLVYSLVRGAAIDYYPYWFINPHESPGGWNGVALFSTAILIGFLIVSAALIWLGNNLKRNVA